jgi:mRNA interferase MazF
MVIQLQQGQIWWVDLPESEHRQPVLVVQSDAFNKSQLETVVCVELTPDWKLGAAPGNVVIAQSDSNLPKVSVANVTHLLTIDKRYLTQYISTLPTLVLESVLDGIELVLGR